MSDGTFDVWLLDFSGSPNASEALQRWFGIDAARAERILATVPRIVRHGATRANAEEVAAALRILGAKVDVRPAASDAKASGTELVRPNRVRTAATLADDDGMTAAKLDAPVEPSTEGVEPRVAEPRLDLDAPLSGPPAPAPRAAAAKTSAIAAPRPAPKPAAPEPASGSPAAPKAAAKPKPAASLDPLDPMTAGGEALELAFEPDKEKEKEAAKPVVRQGVDAEALKRIEAQRAAEENPEAAKEQARFKLPSVPSWLLRSVLGAILVGLLFWGLRTAGRSFVASTVPVPTEPVGSLEERALASAVEVDAFLARPDAHLGIDQGRNRALASSLRTQGATRLLAADIAQIDGRDVALTLIVELPSSPLRRRRVEAAVQSYEQRRVVDPETVEPPGPEESRLFIELE